MKVSIITVSYNSEKYIFDAIQSVNKQTYEDIEHIFIDGNSTDRTLEKIKIHSLRNKTIISENDNGIYNAMNKGLNIASGDIIGILNSDDIYAYENVILDMVNSFKKYNKNIFWADLRYVHRDNSKKIFRVWNSQNLCKHDLLKGKIPPHPTFFLKRQLIDKIGLFDEKISLAADYDFMKRALVHENFDGIYLNQALVNMRLGGVTSKNFKNILSQNIEITNSLKSSFSDFSYTRFIISKFLTKIFELINAKIYPKI